MEHTNSMKIYAKWTTKMQRNISILSFISFGSMDHMLKKDDMILSYNWAEPE